MSHDVSTMPTLRSIHRDSVQPGSDSDLTGIVLSSCDRGITPLMGHDGGRGLAEHFVISATVMDL